MELPRKKILTKDDLAHFHSSPAYAEYVAFVEQLNRSVQGLTIQADLVQSHVVTSILSILDTLTQWSADIPPVENKLSRFGNPAFRDFYDKVAEVNRFPSLQVPCTSTCPHLFRFDHLCRTPKT
ncbi:hypothetical protein BC936DRAFT_144820 [Jimgerdemannia flammicorona]|uniref:Serine/threonine-protein phosphatase 2A activator n=1 Tax=Jimgerdemannia flammicorona TaxID=994334 RepID=A0A433DBJ8_9FUNG|nr:hypothetical protein BC936DRAFT_144820 [Jimgerdemannia flammicorona]